MVAWGCQLHAPHAPVRLTQHLVEHCLKACPVPPCDGGARARCAQVLRAARLRVYNEGEPLTVEGSATRHVFIVLRGTVELHARGLRASPAGARRSSLRPAAFLLQFCPGAWATSPACAAFSGTPVGLAFSVCYFSVYGRMHALMNACGGCACAGPGALLCTWPVLLRRERITRRVAGTIVLAYSIPFPEFKALMERYDSINAGAWQACGATLALMAGEASFADYTFNDLQTLFRCAAA
jgi:hypothetical protein